MIFQPPSKLSLSKASKWIFHFDLKNASSVSLEALNPLCAYVLFLRSLLAPKGGSCLIQIAMF
ncbi:hypothetical protein CsSME_00003790 [Camellia sinensis var. sinensis]